MKSTTPEFHARAVKIHKIHIHVQLDVDPRLQQQMSVASSGLPQHYIQFAVACNKFSMLDLCSSTRFWIVAQLPNGPDTGC
jgi:hypothetical protein